MTKKHRFKKVYAYELLSIAESDLDSAEVLLVATKGRAENVGFLAQQSIEKAVKAVLCHFSMEVPLTHNLELLFELVPEKSQFQTNADVSELSLFATVKRYEEGPWELDHADMLAMVEFARDVLQWSRDLVGPEPTSKKTSG